VAALEVTTRKSTPRQAEPFLPLVADMSDDNSVEAMVDAAAVALGGIDILVNNAAVPGGTEGRRHCQHEGVRTARGHQCQAGWLPPGGALGGAYMVTIRSATISALTKT
jgi:NAD(P)-dependent dehydrogenase (short-subunit alcohol dehydrogenase family)